MTVMELVAELSDGKSDARVTAWASEAMERIAGELVRFAPYSDRLSGALADAYWDAFKQTLTSLPSGLKIGVSRFIWNEIRAKAPTEVLSLADERLFIL